MPIRPVAPRHEPELQPDPNPDQTGARVGPVARHRSRPGKQSPASSAPSAAPAAPYDVGYGKPPEHTRFKPGQSGNLKGRPRAAKGLKTITRELLIPKVTVRTAAGEMRMSRIQAVLHKLVEQGMKGNPRALTQLLSLYASAVPDTQNHNESRGHDSLTPTDEAILAEFKAMILGEGGQK